MTLPAPAADASLEQLQQALAELRRADLRKDEFLGTLGHELRNALTPIRIALQMLGMPGMDPVRSRELRDTTDRQLMRMVRMIDELMDVSQLARGKLALRLEAVELAPILDGAVDSSRSAMKSREHSLKLDIPAETIVVQADRTRLTQVLAILLGNAARYTEPGGCIALSVARTAAGAEIRVEDSGCGIEPDALQLLFEPFGSVGRRAQEGLGLSLTLASGLTALHNGSLTAQSEGSGKGSTFILRLPLA